MIERDDPRSKSLKGPTQPGTGKIPARRVAAGVDWHALHATPMTQLARRGQLQSHSVCRPVRRLEVAGNGPENWLCDKSLKRRTAFTSLNAGGIQPTAGSRHDSSKSGAIWTQSSATHSSIPCSSLHDGGTGPESALLSRRLRSPRDQPELSSASMQQTMQQQQQQPAMQTPHSQALEAPQSAELRWE